MVLETRRTVVDDFYPRLIRLLEQDVLGLEITVDDVVVALEFQSLQDLDGEATNQADRNTLEVIRLDELVKVHAQ